MSVFWAATAIQPLSRRSRKKTRIVVRALA
jgi:hypothetical protein